MWTSLPAALVTLLVLSVETTTAHFDAFHLKHGGLHRSGRNRTRPGTEVVGTTVVVTVTVQPMPIGTSDGVPYPGTSDSFPSATDVSSGIFPPGPGGTGTGVIGTGTGTVSFPIFTNPPVISVPTGTDGNSTSKASLSLPAFTRSAVIDVPNASNAPESAGTSSAAQASASGSSTFPLFTGSPVISIPSATGPTAVVPTPTADQSSSPEYPDVPSVSSPLQDASTSAKQDTTPAPLSFPLFTGTPVVQIPGASAQSVAETPASTPTPSSVPSSDVPFLRGVNLGGWLVLEKWMTQDLFSGAFSGAIDQYTFDSIPGAAQALQQHWSTFFTEADISTLAAAGFNALRIPIGYWAYDNSGTPYQTGADAFLEQGIQWARNHGMKVLVDLHGSPGSQNGFDNSGQAGEAHWQQGDNLDKSIQILQVMAKKYGAQEYADVVVGLQMVNEPISWGNNVFSVTQSWSEQAYAAVKAAAQNPNLLVVMHDAFQGGVAWEAVSTAIRTSTVSAAAAGSNPFTVDEHLYQLFTDQYNALNQDQHIAAACQWSSSLSASTSFQKTIVGEFSAATNICLLPDGTTIPGTSCSQAGCECQSGDWTTWSQGMKDQIRKFVEAQLDTFESSSAGYFAWSAKAPGGWGVLNMLSNGVWPATATERKFPNQCGGVQRAMRERSMRWGSRR